MPVRHHERLEFTRRRLIQTFGAAAGALISAPLIGQSAFAQAAFTRYPFTLGVASGDPAPDGFVIWTRLAPDPMQIGYGMPTAPFEVDWEVASDERFANVVQSGKAVASPILGHSVHVEVAGLQPARHYWYRFTAADARSPTGRARTAPLSGAALAHARIGVAGCQRYDNGLFTAHRYLAAEDVDFVYLYGDYIYEYYSPPSSTPYVRTHLGGICYSLDDYRRRYAQYKMDPDLQASHAAHSWFAVWDDHEIDNNWASDMDMAGDPAPLFNLRRQAAAQAYYENLPLRATAMPAGAAMQLYRCAQYGDLLDVSFLDTRQYRTDQPCDDRYPSNCPGVNAPDAQFMGLEQEAWLFSNLGKSTAKWNVLAQQVMMMDLDRAGDGKVAYNVDSWAGYRAPRNRVLSAIQSRNIQNVVVLTGDEHVNYAGELHLDDRDPGPRPIALEFVGTSIASGGDGQDQNQTARNLLDWNPPLKFVNQQRGYLICDVTPERWLTEFRVLDKISDTTGQLSTRARLAIASGSNQLSAA